LVSFATNDTEITYAIYRWCLMCVDASA